AASGGLRAEQDARLVFPRQQCLERLQRLLRVVAAERWWRSDVGGVGTAASLGGQLHGRIVAQPCKGLVRAEEKFGWLQDGALAVVAAILVARLDVAPETQPG